MSLVNLSIFPLTWNFSVVDILEEMMYLCNNDSLQICLLEHETNTVLVWYCNHSSLIFSTGKQQQQQNRGRVVRGAGHLSDETKCTVHKLQDSIA